MSLLLLLLPMAILQPPHAQYQLHRPAMRTRSQPTFLKLSRRDASALALLGVAGTVGAATLGTAAVLGWEIGGGSADNRGLGLPLSTEEARQLEAQSGGKALPATAEREDAAEDRAVEMLLMGMDIRLK